MEIVARSESAVSAVASASTPMKILKTESTFAKSFGQRGYVYSRLVFEIVVRRYQHTYSISLLAHIHRPNKEKKISFADEHGRNIADVRSSLTSGEHRLTWLVCLHTNIVLYFMISHRTYTSNSCTIQRQVTAPRNCRKVAVRSVNSRRGIKIKKDYHIVFICFPRKAVSVYQR